MVTRELRELLNKAGHRPPKHGKRWTCGNCPKGHSPAMTVDEDLYYCHRCHRGGNRVTLERELGIKKERPMTWGEKQDYYEHKRIVMDKTKRFLIWVRDLRADYIFEFRRAFDYNTYWHDQARKAMNSDEEIQGEVIERCRWWTEREEKYREKLDWIDDPKQREVIYWAWSQVFDARS